MSGSYPMWSIYTLTLSALCFWSDSSKYVVGLIEDTELSYLSYPEHDNNHQKALTSAFWCLSQA